MAEKIVNLTSTLEVRPSIFEIIAQNALNDTLHPALQKIVQFLVSLSPSKCGFLTNYYEEIFLIFQGLLQNYYLQNHGSSFAEHFYGLRRTSLDGREIKYQKQLSLLFLVIFPYIKKKIDKKVITYRLENLERGIITNFHERIKMTAVTLHSSFEIIWKIMTLVNYLRYMSGKTECQLPSFTLIKLKLVYSPQEDFPNFWSLIFKGHLSLSELGAGLVKNAIISSLEITAFFIQFLRSWNAEGHNYDVHALPLVPPPSYDSKALNYKGKCPLCLQNWKIPTVLAVSGYVFCFPCILRYLHEKHRCPVTCLPAKPLDIIRLYDGD